MFSVIIFLLLHLNSCQSALTLFSLYLMYLTLSFLSLGRKTQSLPPISLAIPILGKQFKVRTIFLALYIITSSLSNLNVMCFLRFYVEFCGSWPKWWLILQVLVELASCGQGNCSASVFFCWGCFRVSFGTGKVELM